MTFEEWYANLDWDFDEMHLCEKTWNYQQNKLDIAIGALEIIQTSYKFDTDRHAYDLATKALEKLNNKGGFK